MLLCSGLAEAVACTEHSVTQACVLTQTHRSDSRICRKEFENGARARKAPGAGSTGCSATRSEGSCPFACACAPAETGSPAATWTLAATWTSPSSCASSATGTCSGAPPPHGRTSARNTVKSVAILFGKKIANYFEFRFDQNSFHYSVCGFMLSIPSYHTQQASPDAW